MAKEIGENTKVTIDLKTIGLAVGGLVMMIGMWFTLQGDIKELQNQIAPEEFVKKITKENVIK